MISWQALPNYAGEIFFFSVSDSAAVPTSVLKENREWTLSQRRDFAKRALIALAEFSEPSEGALLHRALDAESVRVRADNTPLFAGWRWARLTTAQTLSAGQTGDNLGPFAAPEVRSNGLAAATPSSDLFSLCAVLVELFSAEEVPDVREILLLGCDPDPSRRPGARDIVDLLPEPVALPPIRPEAISPMRWDEGHHFKWKDSNYRVVAVLGQGSVGRTFKLEQLDREAGEPIGTFVGKAVFNPDLGPLSLAAYQRLRPLTLREGLSNILECSNRWNANELMTLLRWTQGVPLSTWSGDLDFIAQVQGVEIYRAAGHRLVRDAVRGA